MNKIIFYILVFCGTVFPQSLIENIGSFEQAEAFFINPAGNIFVTDISRNEVAKIDTLGNLLQDIGGYGWSESAFDEPVDIYANTLRVYVTDKNNNRIQVFDKDLNFIFDFNTNSETFEGLTFAYPTSCAVSNQGDFFILDSDNNRILKYNPVGGFLLQIGNYDAGEFMLKSPRKMAISPDGKIFVIDEINIFVYDQFGTGLLKLSPDFIPININITFSNLVVNSADKIKYVNLKNSNNRFDEFSFEEENIVIKDCAIFNQKIYILTENTILIYTLL